MVERCEPLEVMGLLAIEACGELACMRSWTDGHSGDRNERDSAYVRVDLSER